MFESILAAGLTAQTALLCTAVSFGLGCICAAVYRMQKKHSANLMVTLMLLPVIVQVVIMLVNGNLGTGVAVMGAFSLVRFRSLPGNSRDILCIFFAMAIGLATGMGYVGFAVVFTIITGAVLLISAFVPFLNGNKAEKQLIIHIPEQLDYTDCFKDIFDKYTSENSLFTVKTTNMGTMFQLTYIIKFKSDVNEKAMLDEIRCRNGNLTIQCGHAENAAEAL